jgi:hypothetical protein
LTRPRRWKENHGNINVLQSGLLVYDALADQLLDAHPGAHETDRERAPPCAADSPVM